MTPAQLSVIPNRVLMNSDQLLDYLTRRGQSLSLLELDHERRRRGLVDRQPRRAKR